MKVAHLTSVHSAYDTRVFHKECVSLARAGYDVVLVVPHSQNEVRKGVRIHAAPEPEGRVERMGKTIWDVYRAAREEDAALYHLHDPELLPIGVLLELAGKPVLYDVHEDVPLQIRTKYWLPAVLRWPVAVAAKVVERAAVKALSGVVAATPSIAEKFSAEKTITVQNFPIRSELVSLHESAYAERPFHVAYVGGATRERGIREMVHAFGQLPDRLGAQLVFAGRFMPLGLEQETENLPGWARVKHLGWVDRSSLRSVLGQARAGLVVFHPSPNHMRAQPNKLFEYMSAGLPVIASDFPLWRRIVKGARCGLLVDPRDPTAIANAVQWLLEHPAEAEEMGRRGRDAVEQRYNWNSEFAKLSKLYEHLTA